MADQMRALLVRESFADGCVPAGLPGRLVSAALRRLDGTTPIEVLEMEVSSRDATTAADVISRALLTPGWYAHLVDGELMIVVFPGEHYVIHRGDDAAVDAAQNAGGRHGIPISQMRFDEMFDDDHPDARVA